MTKEEALKQALGYVERNCPALVFGEIKEALAQPVQETWCMKMNGCKTKCEDCPDKPPEERNFCPRCGKRTADPTTIHTCTPPT